MPEIGKSIAVAEAGSIDAGQTISAQIATEVSVYGYDGTSIRVIALDTSGNVKTSQVGTSSISQVAPAPYYQTSDTPVTLSTAAAISTSHRTTLSEPGAGSRAKEGVYLFNLRNPATVSLRADFYIRSTLSGGVDDSKLTELTVTSSGNGSQLINHLFASPQGIVVDLVNLAALSASSNATVSFNIVALK